jgi:DNA invertase Pin-like site-specific DNA recombinase
MTTIGYARVSTADQPLDRQSDELVAAGAETVYSEVGCGRRGAVRPQWDELLRSLRSGDTLIVTELSRLGRSAGQLSVLAEELQDRGVALRILSLGIDTAKPAGKFVYSLLASVGQMERELLIEHATSGLAAARSGGRSGSPKREFSLAAVRKAQLQYDKGGMTVSEIARVAGVSNQTLYRYLNNGPAT